MTPTPEQLRRVLPSYARTIITLDPLDGMPGEVDGVSRVFFNVTDPQAPPKGDILYANTSGCSRNALKDKMRPFRLKVQRDGGVICLEDCQTLSFGEHLEVLGSVGLRFYAGWRFDSETGSPDPIEESPEQGAGPFLFLYQRERYDPVAHARTYTRDLDFYNALGILQAVPPHWLESDEERGRHALEFLMAYLTQDRCSGGEYRQEHFRAALYHYSRACTWIPEDHGVYSCMAAFWRGVGRPDVGQRLLETVNTIIPSAAIQTELEHYTHARPTFPPPFCPEYQPDAPLRILFLCHPESDFGSDVLHDGLRRVLGPENVVAFPWKPVLHGLEVEKATRYPCTFNWPEGPTPLEDIIAQAVAGKFDAVLYSDTLGTLPRADTRLLLDAAGDTPLFVMDMWDECGDSLPAIRERDGLGTVAGFFKREMIQGCTFGPHTWPLLFSFPEDRIPTELRWDGREGIFWTGKLIGGARRLQLSWLETQLPITAAYGMPLPPEDYAIQLQKHLMGFSLPGNGYDTVRYWELPAHGTLLLAERPPLAIPHDFEDGKHAILFETVSELKEKAEYYLAHRDEAIAIAQAGHAHLLAHHTGSARARQCLAQIQQRIAELTP